MDAYILCDNRGQIFLRGTSISLLFLNVTGLLCAISGVYWINTESHNSIFISFSVGDLRGAYKQNCYSGYITIFLIYLLRDLFRKIQFTIDFYYVPVLQCTKMEMNGPK